MPVSPLATPEQRSRPVSAQNQPSRSAAPYRGKIRFSRRQFLNARHQKMLATLHNAVFDETNGLPFDAD